MKFILLCVFLLSTQLALSRFSLRRSKASSKDAGDWRAGSNFGSLSGGWETHASAIVPHASLVMNQRSDYSDEVRPHFPRGYNTGRSHGLSTYTPNFKDFNKTGTKYIRQNEFTPQYRLTVQRVGRVGACNKLKRRKHK